ncbi:MCP four helix bundle domain-containing protein [Pontibacter liquoris]|uniref:MCP four helix bundle domain-containing protein n=1 Tax=Pontibacter liquoris TaxID=2905677 RepID=UPI001FA80958|nr:MCP four helix bundle domain-containing protein [Pontibacter liquoris]
MSWNYTVSQRNKISLGLGFVFILIILANWFVQYSMARIGGQFASVYHDRLVPALDISALLEKHYENRQQLEGLLQTPSLQDRQALQAGIISLATTQDSLLARFEITYLTEKESANLRKYKMARQQWLGIQQQLLVYSNRDQLQAAASLYQHQGETAFTRMLPPLHALLSLQEEVGQELYRSAGQQVQALKVLSYLVIALAIILALLVGTLLQTSRKLRQSKPQQYRWN